MCIAISKLFIWAERLALVEEVRESLNLNNKQHTTHTKRGERSKGKEMVCGGEGRERERERERKGEKLVHW